MKATKLIINGEEQSLGGNGDMMYSHFNRYVATGNNIDLHLNTYYDSIGDFTVNAPSDIKEGQTYLLRVNNGATAYTMTLGTGITNLQGTDITLTPNAIDMFVFLATKDGDDPVRLELQKEINTSSGGGIYSFFLSDETSQTELDNLWSRWDSIPDEAFDDSIIMIESGDANAQGTYFFNTQDSQDAYFFGATNMLRIQFEMEGWYTRTGVYSVTFEPLYTAGTGISISGNVISSTVEESNTKTFYLSSTSDLTNAQAAYDWYLAGKNPIVVYSNKAYTLYNNTSTNLTFVGCLDVGLSGDAHHIANKTLSFTISSDTVTAITTGYTPSSEYFLRTNYNYSTPYTPLYDGSPTTKKYVDDSVSVVSGDTGITYTIKVSHSDPSGVANNVITFVTPLLEYSALIALNDADAILRELNTDALGYFQKFQDELLIGAEYVGEGGTSEETTIVYYYLMNSPEGTVRVVDDKGFKMDYGANVWNFIDY